MKAKLYQEVVLFDNYEDASLIEEILWDYVKGYLEALCEDPLIITGIVGRWNGRAEGGTVVQSYFELQDLWKDCEYIKIWDAGGHLYIKCSHHDGTNNYEVKKLTERGYERYNNWEYGYGKYCSDREIHEKLIHCSTYSRLPRLAKAMEEIMYTQITPHGQKKALSDLKQWYTVHGPSASVTLMIDLSDGAIWADCFLDQNSWKEYPSNSIVPLQLPRDEFGQMVAPTMRNIKESAVKMLRKIY